MLAVLPAAYYNAGKESESVEKTYEELQIKDDFMFGLIMRNPKLALGDDTTKIILNTKGTMDDISPELKSCWIILTERFRQMITLESWMKQYNPLEKTRNGGWII